MADDVEKLPRDYRKTLRVAAILAALAGPPFFYVHALDRKVSDHLAEVQAMQPRMFEYVREERAARCSIARNVYALCRQTSVVCEPVSASCGDQ